MSPNPVGLSAEFADDPTKKSQWRGFIRKSRLDASPDLAEMLFAVTHFLQPVDLRPDVTDGESEPPTP